FFSVSSISITGFQNYAIPVLDRLYGTPLAVASAALTASLLGGVGGFVVGGFLVGMTNRHGAIAGWCSFGVAMLFLVMAAGVVPVWGLMILATLSGFLLGVISPSRDVIVR